METSPLPGLHGLRTLLDTSIWMLCVLTLAGCAGASITGDRTDAGAEAITREDLRRDLFTLAGDSLRGRRGGTEDEMEASVWLAEKAREAGLEPAGDNGTYFQFFPMRRYRISPASTVSVGGRALRLWQDVVVMSPVEARVEGIAFTADAPLSPGSASGRVTIATLRPPPTPPERWLSLWSWRHTSASIVAQRAALQPANPAAMIFIADSTGLAAFANLVKSQKEGRYLLEEPGVDPRAGLFPIPVLLIRPEAIPAGTSLDDLRVALDLKTESFIYPSVNVVARAPGSDPALRAEHVLFSGHQDHDGVNEPVGGDSIWNGADDNASVSVAMLAIGRAFVAQPARRSALFVWHGSEERGLLGSTWFAKRPTVPRESLVAVLNGDMIGRNHPDSAALLGVTPPHRNSTDLVAMAMAANPGFAVDSSWDAPAHPELWYFRSDHLPYARAGIPALFFTTLLHPEYHTPEDEPERIDLTKLERMTRWIHGTGRAAANASARVRLDPGFKLER